MKAAIDVQYEHCNWYSKCLQLQKSRPISFLPLETLHKPLVDAFEPRPPHHLPRVPLPDVSWVQPSELLLHPGKCGYQHLLGHEATILRLPTLPVPSINSKFSYRPGRFYGRPCID